jgi:hypothetical protein
MVFQKGHKLSVGNRGKWQTNADIIHKAKDFIKKKLLKN